MDADSCIFMYISENYSISFLNNYTTIIKTNKVILKNKQDIREKIIFKYINGILYIRNKKTGAIIKIKREKNKWIYVT